MNPSFRRWLWPPLVALVAGLGAAAVLAITLPAVPLWVQELGDSSFTGYSNFSLVKTSDPALVALVMHQTPCEALLLEAATGRERRRWSLPGNRLGVAMEGSFVDLKNGHLLVHFKPIHQTPWGVQFRGDECRLFHLDSGEIRFERRDMEVYPSVSCRMASDGKSFLYAHSVHRQPPQGETEWTRTLLEQVPCEPGAKPETLASFVGIVSIAAALDEQTVLLNSTADYRHETVQIFDLRSRSFTRQWPNRGIGLKPEGDTLGLRESPYGGYPDRARPPRERVNWRTGECVPLGAAEAAAEWGMGAEHRLRDLESGRVRLFGSNADLIEHSWGEAGAWLGRFVGMETPRHVFTRTVILELDGRAKPMRTVGTVDQRRSSGAALCGGILIQEFVDPKANQFKLVAWDLLAPTRPWGKALASGLGVAAFVLLLFAAAHWLSRPRGVVPAHKEARA